MAEIQTNKKMPSVDMTPMVDLGFLLLISLMSLNFLAKPKAMEIYTQPLPDKNGCCCCACDKSLYLNVVVDSTEKPKCYFVFEEGFTKGVFDVKSMTFKELRRFIIEQKQEIKAAGHEPAYFVVGLKALSNAKYGTFVNVVDEMKITQANFVLTKLTHWDSTIFKLHDPLSINAVF